MKKVVFFSVILVVILSLLTTSIVSAASNYKVVAIPLNSAFTLNNWGAVGGYIRTYVDSYETLGYNTDFDTASIWQNGNLIELPFSGFVRRLNDAGMAEIYDDTNKVLVLYNTNDGSKVTIDKNIFTSIEKLNNIGQIVGSYATDTSAKAVVWTPTYTMSLEVGNRCEFTGINNLGHAIGDVVSVSALNEWNKKPFLWKNELFELEVPTYGGTVSDINDKDIMVGSCFDGQYNPTSWMPVWWDHNGSIRNLPNLGLPGEAVFINNKDQIIGQLDRKWVIWDSWTANPVFLKDIGDYRIDNVEDFNDVGMILALGWQNGHYGPLLLTPTVPEPGSFLALATGLIGLTGFGLRRRR
ncbi:MAG: PEP-CTERM sorting domain-containing protein [Patescibacteria group bacterium]|nr:PEP-CTERM sorting domain-containing protein [Patescibacteria group bacterium]